MWCSTRCTCWDERRNCWDIAGCGTSRPLSGLSEGNVIFFRVFRGCWMRCAMMLSHVITTLFLLETLYLGDGTIKEDHRQTGCEQQCRNLVTKEPRRDCERMQWCNDFYGCSWKQCPVLRDDHSCKGINLPPFLIWDRLRLTYHHRVVKGTCKFETVHLGCWMPLTEFGWLFKHEIWMDIINDMWNARCYSLQPLNTASLTRPSPSNAVDWCRNLHVSSIWRYQADPSLGFPKPQKPNLPAATAVPCGSQVVSYGTLGSPEAKTKLLAHPLVQKAADMEGLVPAQVLMKWALQKGAALCRKMAFYGKRAEEFKLWNIWQGFRVKGMLIIDAICHSEENMKIWSLAWLNLRRVFTTLNDPYIHRKRNGGFSMAVLLLGPVSGSWTHLSPGLHLIPTTSKVEHLQQLLELPASAPLRRATVALLESIPQWEAPIYHPYLPEIE